MAAQRRHSVAGENRGLERPEPRSIRQRALLYSTADVHNGTLLPAIQRCSRYTDRPGRLLCGQQAARLSAANRSDGALSARSERLRPSLGWVIPGVAFSDKPVRRQRGRSPGHLTMKSEAWALHPFCATYIARRADGIRRGGIFPAAQQGRRECPSISSSTTR